MHDDYFSWGLLFVFALHLAIFARLYLRHKRAFHGLVALTFVLLLISHSLRLGWPSATLSGIGLSWYPRVVAWILGAAGTAFLLRDIIVRRRRQATDRVQSKT